MRPPAYTSRSLRTLRAHWSAFGWPALRWSGLRPAVLRPRIRRAAAAGLLTALALTAAAPAAISGNDPVVPPDGSPIARDLADGSSRSAEREPVDDAGGDPDPAEPDGAAEPDEAADDEPAADEPAEDESVSEEESDEEEEADEEPAPPAPIGGLNARQMENAATIIRVGQELGLPERAYVVALATAMQESRISVLANPAYPESYDLPHDGSGYDHDSVGIFQQRPSSGWGTVAQCMDPEHSTRSFYRKLMQIPAWQQLPVTVAAQRVQVSAFPDHYARHEPLARQLVEVLA